MTALTADEAERIVRGVLAIRAATPAFSAAREPIAIVVADGSGNALPTGVHGEAGADAAKAARLAYTAAKTGVDTRKVRVAGRRAPAVSGIRTDMVEYGPGGVALRSRESVTGAIGIAGHPLAHELACAGRRLFLFGRGKKPAGLALPRQALVLMRPVRPGNPAPPDDFTYGPDPTKNYMRS
jgi:uncharacterized protein GlcG (DUF336 family)